MSTTDKYIRCIFSINQIERRFFFNTTSSSRRLEFGVPQSSILGPLQFVFYTAAIQDIISAHNVDCMF